MGLKTKFNLVMLIAFLAGLSLAAVFLNRILQDTAQREVLQQAAILTAEASAVREYTVREIVPLLSDQMKQRFLPHSVPSWSAQTILRGVKARFPDYSYKEAALNPTNPEDRATEWENDLIAQFRNTPTLTELITERPTPTGPALIVARPIQIKDAACLTCHSVPANAPPAMLDLYGTGNGFGWKLNEIIGAAIVSVPVKVARDRAGEIFVITLGGLALILIAMMVLLNIMLHYIIVRPVRQISAVAGEVSMGKLDAPEVAIAGSDEISSLADSFNRMRRSLANAMKMLGD